MIPVTQTKVVVKKSTGEEVQRGNCYAAAIASIMELPITEVPNVETLFEIDGSFWAEVMHTFLNSKGWDLATNNWFKVFHDGRYGIEEGKRSEMMEYCQNKFYLVSGNTVRNIRHICIYQNGRLVHDPHPSKEGLVTLEDFQELYRLDSNSPTLVNKDIV